MNNFKRALCGVLLSIAVCQMACAAAVQSWQVVIGSRAVIEVDGKLVLADRALQRKLRRAEAAAFLPLNLSIDSGESLRWLLVREPSRVRGDAGFCGAGHEDHLFLVKVIKSVGKTVDDFLAQSCLRSITMNMDQLDELLGAISVDAKRKQLTFEQSISNETGSIRSEVNIAVVSGRMKVSMRKTAD